MLSLSPISLSLSLCAGATLQKDHRRNVKIGADYYRHSFTCPVFAAVTSALASSISMLPIRVMRLTRFGHCRVLPGGF